MSPVPPTKDQIAAGAKQVVDFLSGVVNVDDLPEIARPMARGLAEKVVGDLLTKSGVDVQAVLNQISQAADLRDRIKAHFTRA